MYYDMQSDKLYDDYAMEGIFGKLADKGMDTILGGVNIIYDLVDGKPITKKGKDKEKAKSRAKEEKDKDAARVALKQHRVQNADKYNAIKRKYNCKTKSALIALIKNFINSELKKIKMDKRMMDRIQKYCKENGSRLPSFATQYTSDDYFIIFGYDQDFNIEFSDIVYHIAEKIEREYDELLDAHAISISTGDGDEGCIYLNEIKY